MRFFFAKSRTQKFRSYLKEHKIQVKDLSAYENNTEEINKTTFNQKIQQKLDTAFNFRKDPGLVEYSKSFFPILLAVLVFRSFLIEPFQIPTGSMIPSLNVGDYILVNKYSYGIRLPVIGTKVIDIGEPQRGDVMVFIPPHDPVYYVKRVAGLPGELFDMQIKSFILTVLNRLKNLLI